MKERDLFIFIKDNLIPDLECSSNQYEYYDCYSQNYNLHIELKCRRQHYPTLLIEYSKYKKLIKHINCRYVCSTPEGIFSFDLHKIEEPEWFERQLPTTSHFQNRNLKLKKVGYLQLAKAKILQKNCI